MSGSQSEEQWTIIGYCDRCGCTLFAIGERVQWASEYCDDGKNGGHTLEKELYLEEFDEI